MGRRHRDISTSRPTSHGSATTLPSCPIPKKHRHQQQQQEILLGQGEQHGQTDSFRAPGQTHGRALERHGAVPSRLRLRRGGGGGVGG